MRGFYPGVMLRFIAPFAALLLTLPLGACTPVFQSLTRDLTLYPNPTVPAPQASADALSGTYLGDGRVLFVTTRYRLVLNVNAGANRADGVLTNLDNARAYALTGKYLPVTPESGSLEAEIFEGSRKAGSVVARLNAGELRGTLTTLAFAYDLTLKRQP